MSSAVKPCNCEHKFQDRVYGKKRRVHTIGKSNITCTVCGKRK